MNEIVQEWLRKAESDWKTATLIWQAEQPIYDAVCFHAQQCIEKLMKALLIQNQRIPEYTHNLVSLHSTLVAVCPEWQADLSELAFLSQCAVEFRYPGRDATHEDAATCLEICERLRTQALSILQS